MFLFKKFRSENVQIIYYRAQFFTDRKYSAFVFRFFISGEALATNVRSD